MTSLKTTVIALSLACLPLAVSADPTHDQLVGTWYAIDYDGSNETTKQLVKRMDDHTYVATSITCTGMILTWVEREMGTWQLEKSSLIDKPETQENYNGTKALDPTSSVTYTDVSFQNNALSYKNANETRLEYKPVDSFFRMGCRSLSTIN
ncbi:hypothetical protein Q7C_2593 [Methylophaga frappieri]|uniref:Lipocalin-like domain-containing protein n=1 Tax=Methylophaga frappieri (strain ATCC BAA-2434 / DSM 25690 / JAM7) TaxID=754477 RepID=I1YLC1_METFJ|nr:hypothetical protein [Methylophaga frappieri]AFJ03714.1 hypothetical protein Q7C_2593 [Methylophaga frappieri]